MGATVPDRLISFVDHPKRASWIILFLSLAVLALLVWVWLLSGRVSDGEQIRRAEARAAKARSASECRSKIAGTKITNDLLLAIKDLAKIPQTNLKTYLADPLTPAQRANYEDALMRYRKAEAKFVPFPLPQCVRSDP